MSFQSNFIKKIQQKDNHSFTIEWSDGQINEYRLSVLQRNCPCANCIDEAIGKSRIDVESLDGNVRAHRIVSVGRYGLRIYFTSGCSTGIFSFELLRQIANLM